MQLSSILCVALVGLLKSFTKANALHEIAIPTAVKTIRLVLAIIVLKREKQKILTQFKPNMIKP